MYIVSGVPQQCIWLQIRACRTVPHNDRVQCMTTLHEHIYTVQCTLSRSCNHISKVLDSFVVPEESLSTAGPRLV